MDSPTESSRPGKLARLSHGDGFLKSLTIALTEESLSRTKEGSTTADPLVRPRKQVRFQKGLPAIFEYYAANQHHGDDDEESNKENGGDTTTVTTTASRRTHDMTVLSTEHGRARRMLRDISKYDLKTCIKYGVKEPSRRCPKTGLRRWKYRYRGITYVTDSTSRIEVTCYREPVYIKRAIITQEMHDRHEMQAAAIKADPMVCTTHSIVIIDQSGSMRQADVPMFRSRSEAAYGLLALEYIAEQLHNRAANDGAIDSVSVIEMHDDGEVFLQDVPMDWILFNKLLTRQKTSRPRSHGNYKSALGQAQSLIFQKLQQSEGMPQDDLPSFALIFLTDGKPSDQAIADHDARMKILRQTASRLGPKMIFKAIGLGEHDGEFTVLSTMANTLRQYGVDASFEFARRCPAELGANLSSVASTMTVTRENIMSSPRIARDVALRKRSMPKADRNFVAFTSDVNRWCFDRNKDREGDEWPWTMQVFSNNRAIGFEMEELPFGKGRERLAYMFHEIDADGNRLGKALVAKESISNLTSEHKLKFHVGFCRDQAMAQSLAQDFNSEVASCINLNVTEDGQKPPEISFLACCVYQYKTEKDAIEGLLVEGYLEGKFTKYNGNNGYVRKTSDHDKEIGLNIDHVHLQDFLHAFSHWTYVNSDKQLLVCDLQGILNEEGRHPRFELTDPCICNRKTKQSRKITGEQRRTDLGMTGIRSFFRTHKCNAVCRALGLQHQTSDNESVKAPPVS